MFFLVAGEINSCESTCWREYRLCTSFPCLLMKSQILIGYMSHSFQSKFLSSQKKNGWSNHHLYRLNMVESPWIHVFIGWIIILSWWNHHFCWTSSPKAPSPEVLNRHIRPLLECLSAEMWPLQVSLNWRYSLDGLEGKSAPETMDSPHEKWLGLSGFKVSLKPTHGFTI